MPRKKAAKFVKPPEPAYPRVFEGYLEPSHWGRDLAGNHGEPRAFNWVEIRRYRMTVELIDEPVEVLRERLLTLWRTTRRNMHLYEGFHEQARKLGVEDPREFLRYSEMGRDFNGKDGF